MRIYKYLFFLGMLAFAACKSEDSVPDNVISEERMPTIIAGVHIIDGDLYNVAQDPDSLYKYSNGHYQALFKRYGTDSLQFRKSYDWYTKHPGKLDAIYDKVVKILQVKNDSITKIKAPVVKQTAAPVPNSGIKNPAPPVPNKNALPVQ